jgi:hypothetical protein
MTESFEKQLREQESTSMEQELTANSNKSERMGSSECARSYDEGMNGIGPLTSFRS